MNIFKVVKGLYHLIYRNQRILIPLNKAGWATLFTVAKAWSYGCPEPLMFWACVTLDEYELAPTSTMAHHVRDVLLHQRQKTVESLAVHSFSPRGEVQFYETVEPSTFHRIFAWKQCFTWHP